MEAGISVRGKIKGFERKVPFRDYEDHVVDWPLKEPKAKRRGRADASSTPTLNPSPASGGGRRAKRAGGGFK
jgi:hypothetical protein